MQRGGSWDNSDVCGAKKVEWTETDRRYNRGEAFLSGKACAQQTETPILDKMEEEYKKKNRWFGLFP